MDHLSSANHDANPELMRLALKMATGAGKTAVMAMLIIWQTINAVRRRASKKFTRGFLIVSPGLTIRDRLRVLQPNDLDSYYAGRELVPGDMLADLERAKIVITNYHAFKLRERMSLSKGGRSLLQGRGEALHTLETEGQMLQRVLPEMMGMKNIMVLNDEAHHCYREKPGAEDVSTLKGDDKKEAEKNNEAARLWISGLEIVGRKLGINRVIDLSATPFFLSGSGYAEGTLFPWAMSDFALMDAIECGIVKLPRVPVADNIPGGEMPKFRNLWEHIRTRMPKKGRGKAKTLDPLSLPVELQTALEALYGHYKKTFDLWQEHGIHVPPCFIVVCNNTSTSKLVYDYISGFNRPNEDDSISFINGHLKLFRNFDEYGNQLARPRTLLIDSEQLESGDALDKDFRVMASAAIERFRYEMRERGEHRQADNITDQNLLREVMNTVGKKDRLGESIRCVVSVSMLTEGWDANTVTHVLGVRAFGTQLLCEQLMYQELSDMACERITAAITSSLVGNNPIKAILDPYNPAGTTNYVNFNTSKTDRWETDSRRCQINWIILDSDWEAEFCRVAEAHPKVKAYVKNHNLGLEVPYRYGSATRTYIPDFIVLVDDGQPHPLQLIVEIKGYRREDAKDKKLTMETYWVPGVNNLEKYGRWAFAEFTEAYQIEVDFKAKVAAEFDKMITSVMGDNT